MKMRVLAVNVGSSSLKFALDDGAQTPLFTGLLDRFGPQGSLTIRDGEHRVIQQESLAVLGSAAATRALLAWLDQRGASFDAVGHRVVHGGPAYSAPVRVTTELLAALRALTSLAPLHLPPEIEAMQAILESAPAMPQVACFDTAFHRTLSPTARTYALPARLRALGIERFGFHGLSYQYILEELAALAGHDAAQGRVIIAHLGNGASLAAVHHGRCVDTTMGFTPTGGLVMGTRPGDLDPGILLWLIRQKGMAVDSLDTLLQRECGLLGLSGVSADMRDLLTSDRPEAALAVDVFCHTARKHIGALAASLNGLDTLVFTAGIGERASAIRARICAGLEFLGLRLDQNRNGENSPIISTDDSRVSVRILPTNEEQMIIRQTRRLLC